VRVWRDIELDARRTSGSSLNAAFQDIERGALRVVRTIRAMRGHRLLSEQESTLESVSS
jgi:hypothetical protein